MSQHVPSVFTTPCEVCMGRSSWDFLQDFYLRVETADNYARRLEKELYEAQKTTHQCHNTLAQCETSLSASWEILNEERLSHQASQEALMFESERQKETIALLERILKEAILSSEAADILGSRRTTAPKAAIYQATPRLDEKTSTGSGISLSMGEKSESKPQLLHSPVPESHQLGEHESQAATRASNTEISNQNQQNCSKSARSFPSTTNRTQNVYGGTESAQVIEGRKMAQNGVGESPLRQTRFPGNH